MAAKEVRELVDVISSDEEEIVEHVIRNMNASTQNVTNLTYTRMPASNVSYPAPRENFQTLRPITKRYRNPTAWKSTTPRPMSENVRILPRVQFVRGGEQIAERSNDAEIYGAGGTGSNQDKKEMIRARLRTQNESTKDLVSGYLGTIRRVESLLEENRLRYQELAGAMNTIERLFERLMSFELFNTVQEVSERSRAYLNSRCDMSLAPGHEGDNGGRDHDRDQDLRRR